MEIGLKLIQIEVNSVQLITKCSPTRANGLSSCKPKWIGYCLFWYCFWKSFDNFCQIILVCWHFLSITRFCWQFRSNYTCLLTFSVKLHFFVDIFRQNTIFCWQLLSKIENWFCIYTQEYIYFIKSFTFKLLKK